MDKNIEILYKPKQEEVNHAAEIAVHDKAA